jgi:DNA polymerase-1
VAKFKGIATCHPSFLMRSQELLPVAVNDLKKSLIEPDERYSPFPSIDQVRAFRYKRFVADIECPKYRLLGDSAPIEMVGLCGAATEAICVPVRGEYTSELKRIFRDAEEIIGHNILQFDLPRLRRIDIKISEQCKIHDSLLQQHLLCPDLPHDLEFVGSQFVSKPAWKADKSGGWELYCCRDCDVNFQAWQKIYPELREEKLEDLYWNTQVPLAKICLLMHETGFKVDVSQIGKVRTQLLARMEELERQLPEFLRTRTEAITKRGPAPPGTLGKSGKPVKYIQVPASKTVVPWRSADVKQRFFYSKEPGCLGQEPVLDPKSGHITTGKVAVAKLFARTKSPVILAIGELNRIDERLTTFASDEMQKLDRQHPHFNVHGTASGRLSSSDPNLQNIPEPVRVIYVPSHEGWKIIDVDYSNIENRLTAWFAGDPRLKKYDDPKYSDYKILASRYTGIPYDEIVKDNDRQAPYGMAKLVVLGTNYGMGYKKIANTYNLDPSETRRIQEAWKKEIAPTITWQGQTAEIARKQGYLSNPFGRKRWFWTSSLYTESLSFLPQGTAADLIFRAMIGLMYERIGLSAQAASIVCPIVHALPKPARLLLQVHDSLVLECPNDLVDEVKFCLIKVMQQPWPELNGLVIPVSIKVGDNWLGE